MRDPFPPIVEALQSRFGPAIEAIQETADAIPTLWVARDQAGALLRYLKREIPEPYHFLYDLCAIDERVRTRREGQPASDFTVVYHLLSYGRNADIRIKVALSEGDPVLPSITGLWSMANWYEREAFDLYGIVFSGHPDLRRILTDYGFIGHPFRKDFPISGYVEMRYDPDQKRVIYQPVSIEPREVTPRIVRDEHYAEGE